ncbi:uncharacterized protein LOC123931749 [Meles meles]|uniref:uncharacterized protein LOC123931749 n=1 Tax=Meles meles TaxID=9662 RepID=UPI001E69B8BF|nr:uncharacterized protein LOC123931749 [Meles meles]
MPHKGARRQSSRGGEQWQAQPPLPPPPCCISGLTRQPSAAGPSPEGRACQAPGEIQRAGVVRAVSLHLPFRITAQQGLTARPKPHFTPIRASETVSATGRGSWPQAECPSRGRQWTGKRKARKAAFPRSVQTLPASQHRGPECQGQYHDETRLSVSTSGFIPSSPQAPCNTPTLALLSHLPRETHQGSFYTETFHLLRMA